MKRCPQCMRNLLKSDFYRNSSEADDCQSKCKDCERALREELRTKVFAHYGEMCACCGSAELLTIDHIHGGGNAHRRGTSLKGGWITYRWLVKNDFPRGFQTLCQPCNDSKGEGEICLLHGDDSRLTTIAQMVNAGMLQRDIGQAVGLTQTAVSRIMRVRLNINRGRGWKKSQLQTQGEPES